MLRRPAVHRPTRAPPPSNRPSATSKTKTTKQTQSLRTAVKSISYNAVPLPPPAGSPRSQGAAWRPASVARASKRSAAFPTPGTMNPLRILRAPIHPPPPATASPPKNPTQPNPPNRCTKQTQFHSLTRFSAHQINDTTPSPPPGTVTHIRRPTPSTTANRPSRRK